jgi:hypothetical protein
MSANQGVQVPIPVEQDPVGQTLVAVAVVLATLVFQEQVDLEL